MSVTREVREKIFNSDFVQKLGFDAGQVVCIPGEELISCGDEVKCLDKTLSKQELYNLCTGAKNCFGVVVYIIFMRGNDLTIIRGADCKKEFSFEECDSLIEE
jgi:hypothetical protein